MRTRRKPLHPFLIKIGQEWQAIREEKGLTLETAGFDVGLDASNLKKIEKGMNLTMGTFLKLCLVYSISPIKFFKRIDWDLTLSDIDALTIPRQIKKKAAKKTSASKKKR